MGYKSYTPEQVQEITDLVFDKIGKEAKSLSAACRELDVAYTTVHDWIDKDPIKSDKYTRAKENRSEIIFEDILNIADANGKDMRVNDYGDLVTDHDVVTRARLRIDARKWMLGKMQPGRYGDKIDVTSGGKTLNTPTSITFTGGLKHSEDE
jgi:hypothetical protein